jgi:penicillin-binding protein 1A
MYAQDGPRVQGTGVTLLTNGGQRRKPDPARLLLQSGKQRKPRRQRRAFWGVIQFALLPLFLALSIVALLATVGVSFGPPATKFVHTYADLEVPVEPPMPQTTFVYDQDGRQVTTLHAGINRTEVPLSRISKYLQEAVIALEDRSFYKEGGISVPSMIRAAFVDVGSGQVQQGGSTLTQQYVKLMFTGGERTIKRKLEEAVLAQKVDDMYSKDQILEKYLNAVYFGQGAYGAEAAAETYFGKPAADLNVLQAATLAGVIKAPATYDPVANPDGAKERRNLALQAMARDGYIQQDHAETWSKRPIKLHRAVPGSTTPAAYFMDYVRRSLQTHFGVDQTFTGGLRVTTTLDPSLQAAAEDAIASHLSAPQDPSAALVAIDPHTGAIKAMVGGRDFDRVKFNLATQAHRQAGSAFKPFTLATAMTQKIDPNAVMNGPPQIEIPNPECDDLQKQEHWQPSNFADESAGTMSLLQATAHSVNTIFAQLVVDVGPQNVADLAHKMGIRSKLQAVCSITLGSQAVTPLEMADAYATFASQGIHHAPTAISNVKDPSGKVVWQPNTHGSRALDPNDANLVTYALQGVITGGTGTAANIGRPAAGKTGTAQDFVDAWFCGYVPQLVACVWVGYSKGEITMENIEGFAHVFGGSIPAGIWHDFMTAALEGVPIEAFPTPSFVGYDQQPDRIIELPPPPGPPPDNRSFCDKYPHTKRCRRGH